MTESLSRVHNPPFLIFIRHGQTDWNAEGRMQGQKDIPLNMTGRFQATDNGIKLADYLETNGLAAADFDFVASPLGRTRETMELMRAGMALEPESYRCDPVLKELTFGSWEGLTLEELQKADPERVKARRADKYRFVPPGGGESYEMLRDRIESWLVGVNRPTVCVSHGGVMRVLRGMLEELSPVVTAKLDVPQDRVFLWKDSAVDWI